MDIVRLIHLTVYQVCLRIMSDSVIEYISFHLIPSVHAYVRLLSVSQSDCLSQRRTIENENMMMLLTI